MEWLIQGLITALVCYVIRFIWEKFKHYINSSTTTTDKINSKNFTSLKSMKKQFFISLSMIIVPLIIFALFKDFLINKSEILCLIVVILFFGTLVFWGVVEAMFKEISYYRNNERSNNKTQNKQN